MPGIRKINPHARQLRREATEAEARLWSRLRNRQLGGAKFKRQVTIEPYVVDFACAEHRLIVEVDGGQHDEIVDAERTRFLEARGYRVIRFWNHDVLGNTDGVLAVIFPELSPAAPPSPNPLPPAGEGKKECICPPTPPA